MALIKATNPAVRQNLSKSLILSQSRIDEKEQLEKNKE
jgi:hypothetical protein